MSFERYLLEYLIYLVAKSYAQETIRWRKTALALFGRYLKDKRLRSLTEVDRQTAEDYLAALRGGALSRRGGALSDGTCRDHQIALQGFFRWLVHQGKLLVNPLADARRGWGRRSVRLPHPLTAEEMMRVIQANAPTTALGLRDRAILELLYSTGIRRMELVNLNVSDFKLQDGELLIVNGKGGKDRLVPVGQWACYFTETYVKNVRPWMVCCAEEKALFVQHRSGRRLSARAVADVVERAAAKSGVGRHVSPHTFRHTMATHMLHNQADLRHVQAILGHASLRSTQIYTHISIEDLKEVVRRAHPHGKRGATARRSKAAGPAWNS